MLDSRTLAFGVSHAINDSFLCILTVHFLDWQPQGKQGRDVAASFCRSPGEMFSPRVAAPPPTRSYSFKRFYCSTGAASSSTQPQFNAQCEGADSICHPLLPFPSSLNFTKSLKYSEFILQYLRIHSELL